MADNWRRQTVYPPRYFAGHVTVLLKGGKRRRVEFFNAPMIPVSPKEAWIFCGGPGACFYDESARDFRDLHGARLVDIQYAISVYDRARRAYRIEKFNHTFSKDTRIQFAGLHLVIHRPDGGPVYGIFHVNDVLDGVTRCDVPVTQFIS